MRQADDDNPPVQAAGSLVWSSWYLRRREDQVWLQFDFTNLAVDTTAPDAPLLRRIASADAFITVRFPPQHMAEQVITSVPAAWPLDTRLAGGTRLVFRVPQDVATIPFTEETLLHWGALAPAVSPAALARGAVPAQPLPIAEPDNRETALEVPWRLLLSPHGGAGWAHATEPVSHQGRTELWHTRLGAAVPGGVDEDADGRTVRVLWATDADFPAWLLLSGAAGAKDPPDGTVVPAPGLPFRLPLTPRDRVQLVRATADYGIAGYTPDPVDVNHLVLTSVGAWMSVDGSWNGPPTALSILGWRHQVTAGRDQSVRVVQRGYLLQIGRASCRERV